LRESDFRRKLYICAFSRFASDGVSFSIGAIFNPLSFNRAEVDRWTNFTRHFTHLKKGEPAVDRSLLLTAILADAFNLRLEKMAEACPGTSLAKLAWLVAWHIRDESYAKGQIELVNAHHQLPFAAHWGEGATSSSDGQRFRAGGHGESAGDFLTELLADRDTTILEFSRTTGIKEKCPPIKRDCPQSGSHLIDVVAEAGGTEHVRTPRAPAAQWSLAGLAGRPEYS
jgi:hypothetical protein